MIRPDMHKLFLMSHEGGGRTSVRGSFSRYQCLPQCQQRTDQLKPRAVQVDQPRFLITPKKINLYFKAIFIFFIPSFFYFFEEP